MRVIRWIFVIGLLSCAGFLRVGAQERASEYLRLPPAFREFVGDPRIGFRSYQGDRKQSRLFGASSFLPKSGFEERERETRLSIRVADPSNRDEVAEEVARVLAKAFFREVLRRESLHRHERRLRLDALFLSDEAQFVDLAKEKLLGRPASERWFDAWWQVRMGLPQSVDPSHHLVLCLLHYDHFGEKISMGHFCFGLRRMGGDSEGDLLFDFRAPWVLDRDPGLIEGLNFCNQLPLSISTTNLYDWLYTQTEFRHCYVNCWFLPVSKEQVFLLRYLASREVPHPAGQFKALRKNCASLGLALLHRLEPIGTPLPLGRGIADFPQAAGALVLSKFEEEPPFYRLENVTHLRGRAPTAKSKIYPAPPTRSTSRAFRLMRTVSAAN